MELLSLNQRCKKMVKAARTETAQVQVEPFCIHSYENGQTWIDHFNGKKKTSNIVD